VESCVGIGGPPTSRLPPAVDQLVLGTQPAGAAVARQASPGARVPPPAAEGRRRTRRGVFPAWVAGLGPIVIIVWVRRDSDDSPWAAERAKCAVYVRRDADRALHILSAGLPASRETQAKLHRDTFLQRIASHAQSHRYAAPNFTQFWYTGVGVGSPGN